MDNAMTCYSCRWSIGNDDGLDCAMWHAPVKASFECRDFEYEPGTDEDEISTT